MALQDLVEKTVTALGFDLVEIQRLNAGLLRVTIDVPWQGADAADVTAAFITVEDCEAVTRQLQFALEVEGIDYQRLEVSSPGIDRLLRDERDFARFEGEIIDITLKNPMGSAAQGLVAANRKKFRGQLARAAAPATGWEISWSDEPAPKPGQRVSKKRPPPVMQVLGFELDELREARLAPIVNFKGRASDAPQPQTPDMSLGRFEAGSMPEHVAGAQTDTDI